MSPVPIGDLIEHQIGGGWGQDKPSNDEYEPAAVIRGTDLPRIALGDTDSVPRRFHRPSALTKRLLRRKDIVFEVSGGSKDQPVGRSMLVSDRTLDALNDRAICASFCKLVRIDADRADPRFLFRLLQLAYVDGSLTPYYVQSTGITNFKWKQFLSGYSVELPSRETQARVADILELVDDLIINNWRRIALLEQMAHAIYREWFVHFRYPGHEEDELVDSPLGPVPTRFDVATLGACCNINSEQRRPEPDEEIVYIDISALGDRTAALPPPIPGSDAPGRARRVLSDGDIVWSMVRPGRRGHALLLKTQANWIGSTGLAVISPNGVPPSFVFESVSTSTFSDYLVGKEQGAAYPAVRPIDFEQAQIVVPPEEVLRAFDDVVSPIHGLGWELAGQARAAGQLRDLLLPKLVTGSIDVSKLDLDVLFEESAA